MWVAAQGSLARVRPDMRIVVTDDFEKLADRLEGALKRPAVGFEVGEVAISLAIRLQGWRMRQTFKLRIGRPARTRRPTPAQPSTDTRQETSRPLAPFPRPHPAPRRGRRRLAPGAGAA